MVRRMARRSESKERQEFKRAFKEAERASAQERVVLDAASLAALIEHVGAALASNGCDHSLRAARNWALSRAIDPDVLATSLANFGGYCDCEVEANVSVEEIFGATAPSRSGG